MQTLNINLPDSVSLSNQDVLNAIATRLYDTGRLSLQQAAHLAGLTEANFIEELMGQSLDELSVKVYRY